MKFKDEYFSTKYTEGLALNEKDFPKAVGFFQQVIQPQNIVEGTQVYLDIADAYKGIFDFINASMYLKMGLTQEPTNFELNMAMIQCN